MVDARSFTKINEENDNDEIKQKICASSRYGVVALGTAQ